jgi:hypothetical protein
MVDLHRYKTTLEKAGVVFEKGLTNSEIKNIEHEFGFRFPPDLAEFLSYALPVSDKFINWRSSQKEVVLERLAWSADGICFDIEHNDFWLKEWGPRPVLLADAFTVARSMVNSAPKLIPIYAHRYVPDRPNLAGNPVFSVYQTDIIYYGHDLYNYLECEFYQWFGPVEPELKGELRKIEFWFDIVEANYSV